MTPIESLAEHIRRYYPSCVVVRHPRRKRPPVYVAPLAHPSQTSFCWGAT